MEVAYAVIVFLILGLALIALFSALLPPAERPWLMRVLVVALLARLVLAAIFASFAETRVFHEDAGGYEGFGRALALAWHGLRPPVTFIDSAHQNNGWVYVCGAIYYALGDVPALPSCFNCVIGVAEVFMVYRLARCFFHPFVARRAALLTAFVPSMMLWSSVAIKDPLMALLIIIGLYSCVQIKRRFSLGALVGICFSLLAMQPIRFYMIYFLGFAIFVSLFLERGMGMVSGVYKQVLVVGMLAVLLAMAGLTGRAQAGFEVLSLDRVSSFRHSMATTANSGFESDADVSTPIRAILFLPVGVSELLLGPFPWQFGSLRALMAAPETIYWWLLFPGVLSGMWWMFRTRFASTSPLLLFAVTMTMAYSLAHGNVGSGFRQRAQIFVILFIFAALGSYRRRCKNAGLDPDLLLVEPQPAGANGAAAARPPSVAA
jgi:hypothetical protein